MSNENFVLEEDKCPVSVNEPEQLQKTIENNESIKKRHTLTKKEKKEALDKILKYREAGHPLMAIALKLGLSRMQLATLLSGVWSTGLQEIKAKYQLLDVNSARGQKLREWMVNDKEFAFFKVTQDGETLCMKPFDLDKEFGENNSNEFQNAAPHTGISSAGSPLGSNAAEPSNIARG